jgi:hypothetical protein
MTPEQVRIYAAMPPAEKLRLAARFHAAARELKACALRAQHPGWTEATIQKKVRELFLYAAN